VENMQYTNNIDENEVVKFISQNSLGMTTTEVRAQFGIRYEKALRILSELSFKRKIVRYMLGYQTMWRV
jgi:hypothetical protein